MDENRFEVSVLSRVIKAVEGLNGFFTGISRRLSRLALKLRHQKNELVFGERADDIYIISYPKSGTTWMQMIVYQLTTDGNMDFGHIYDVSPWLRNIAFKSAELPAELPSPRIIKTHDPYTFVAKGKKGRFIFLLREGADIAASLYHHRKDYNDNTMSFDSSFELSFVENGDENWFQFMEQWLQNPNKHNILYIRHEDLKTDLIGEVKKIAHFLQVPVSAQAEARIMERCSFAYMKAHEKKFGEQPQQKHQVVYNNFIREGRSGSGIAYFNDSQREHFTKNFLKHLAKYPVMKPYLKSTVEASAQKPHNA